MTKEEKIIDYLNNELYDDELVAVWNVYCARINCDCDVIYYMNEFDAYYSGSGPSEIALRLFNSEYFNPNNDWFIIDGYGNPVSTNFPVECINVKELVEHIIQSNYDFGIDDIREILDSDDED